MNNTVNSIEEMEPPDLPPDKFKTPLPRHKSAFKPVMQNSKWWREANSNKLIVNSSQLHSIYVYHSILKKALAGGSDITPEEKMILWNHPVIVELIKKSKQTDISTVCIPIDKILNYHYYHASKVPELYDSREKWSLIDQIVQFTPPQDEEVSTDSTKSFSFDSFAYEEDLTRIIGKYTIIERREKIKRYKMKLQKYRLNNLNPHTKYHKRSIAAKSKPRSRGKFAKVSQTTRMAENLGENISS